MRSHQHRIEGYLTRLYRYALTLASAQDHARDLVQECAVRALSAAHVPVDEAAYRAWLFGILRNLFIDHVRRAGRLAAERGFTGGVEGDEIWRDEESMISTLTVKLSIPKLSPDHRDIIGLIDIAGFSYEEAARLLDLPIGTVMSRISRARRVLLHLIVEGNVRALDIPKKREAK